MHKIMISIIIIIAGVPSQLEPAGLSRDDVKRPDGARILPYEKGQCLVWDFTCVNTVAASYVKSSKVSKQEPLAKQLRSKEKKVFRSFQGLYFRAHSGGKWRAWELGALKPWTS